ncbi:F11 receptor, tandem duplicate 1 [Archocentrus centrarchus]|uniref:F11 receptor, tandem duplicate 1 n=1 Tax=Archocentrus centrarchus TaxID=63155 RepID=UPI0011EA2468|nr:junctional adhesion molecule A-like [Archocentrus centrarchus]
MAARGLLWMLLFSCVGTGLSQFTVSSSQPNVEVRENQGADLTCKYTGDFGSNILLRWKFKNTKGSQVFVVHDGNITGTYANRLTLYGGTNLRFSSVTRKDNGVYVCEITSADKTKVGETNVVLTVLVPPSVPMCKIPPSVTTGTKAILSCFDENGSPPPTYRWYKNAVLLPEDPSTVAGFKNATYKLNSKGGILEFPVVSKMDTGDYYCESTNNAGPPQSCRPMKMEVRDLNTGGIVAGVIVALLLVALLIFAVWFAKKKGYLPAKSKDPKTNTVYQPTTTYGGGDEDDGDFTQKSSFVV